MEIDKVVNSFFGFPNLILRYPFSFHDIAKDIVPITNYKHHDLIQLPDPNAPFRRHVYDTLFLSSFLKSSSQGS